MSRSELSKARAFKQLTIAGPVTVLLSKDNSIVVDRNVFHQMQDVRSSLHEQRNRMRSTTAMTLPMGETAPLSSAAQQRMGIAPHGSAPLRSAVPAAGFGAGPPPRYLNSAIARRYKDSPLIFGTPLAVVLDDEKYLSPTISPTQSPDSARWRMDFSASQVSSE